MKKAAVVFAMILIFLTPGAFAQEWMLTTADFKSAPVLLRGLSADGLKVAAPDTKVESVIPMDRFVSVQRPDLNESAPSVSFTLAMIGGDFLVGEPGPVVKEKLSWLSPSLGTIPVPFNRLSSISRGLNMSVPEEIPKQDLVTLSNGDTVTGVFTDCQDLKVSLQTDNGPTSIPLESVKRIVFASTAETAPADTRRAFRIRLHDGTQITAATADCDGSKLKLVLPGKAATTVEVPITSVLDIEQLNGPVSWLSSHVPTENVQTPYLGGAPVWPARFDKSVDDQPLRFDGKIYDRGIGVHAYSRLKFAIDPQWTVFRTQYAIDSRRDQPRRYADVTVRILLDGVVVHQQKDFREGILSDVLTLDLKNKKTLTLECDYGKDGDTQAHLDWIEPALLHDLPAATAPVVTPATTGPTSRAASQPATAP